MVQKQKFLWVVSFPPPFGGPEILSQGLQQVWLKKEVPFILIDVSKPRFSQARGKLSILNIIWAARDLLKVFFSFLFYWRIKKVYFGNFFGSGWAFRRDFCFFCFGVLGGKEIYAHNHLKKISFVYEKLSRLEKVIFKWILKRIHLIVVNPKTKQEAISLGAKRVFLLPNGVDVSFFKPRPTKKEFAFLFISRLQKEKGLDLFLEALQELKPKLKRKIKVALAGEGEKEDWFDKLRQDLLPEISLCWFGVVKGKQKLNLLRRSRFLVFPSLVDSCALVVLEALASGVPVLSTDEGVVESCCWGEEEGVIRIEKKASDIAKKLDFVLRIDSKDYKQLSDSARRTIKKHNLDIREMADRLAAFILS